MFSDFMSVRKIPLKMRDPLLPQLSSPSAGNDSRSLLEQMRSVVRKDRDFYEKVCAVPRVMSRLTEHFLGGESFRVFCAGVFEA